jgi:hypothetical protein
MTWPMIAEPQVLVGAAQRTVAEASLRHGVQIADAAGRVAGE